MFDTIDVNQLLLGHFCVQKLGSTFLVVSSKELEFLKLIGVVNDITLLVFAKGNEADLRAGNEDITVRVGLCVNGSLGLNSVEVTWNDLNLVGFLFTFAAIWDDDLVLTDQEWVELDS
jgi:hypothetical protein